MTIFRGPGGGGNANTDAEINALTAISAEATASALVAANAATAASGSASTASTSASTATTGASTATTGATTATTQAGIATTQATNAAASAVSANSSAVSVAALLANPVFTGVPTAPTAAVNNSTTQLATTAYVNAEISNDAVLKTGPTGSGQLPTGTSGQRDGAPALGYVRYNSTLNQYEGYGSGGWAALGGGATGAPGNGVFVETDQAVTGNYTLTAGKNAMTAGPVTINTGVTVTIPTGATWSIV